MSKFLPIGTDEELVALIQTGVARWCEYAPAEAGWLLPCNDEWRVQRMYEGAFSVLVEE